LAGCARTLRDRHRRLCVMSAWKASATGVQICQSPIRPDACQSSSRPKKIR
jgi:hypothetical protein